MVYPTQSLILAVVKQKQIMTVCMNHDGHPTDDIVIGHE